MEKQSLPVTNPRELTEAMARCRAAQKKFAEYTQEQVDRIFLAAATAANQMRIPLAKLAAEETGMGVVEDKVIKNHFASEYIYNAYKDAKTCGVLEEDTAFGTQRIAEPIGVIAAVIPTTNPTSTAIFKTLICLKTRNGIIISPHPRAKGCTIAAARVVLADACGVSDPTVVRAYKKLGFSGYEDLKLTLAQATVSPEEIIHEEISAGDSVQAVRDKVFQSAVLALQFTRDMLEPETLAAAAQMLMNARKIVIFGLGGSAPVAMDLHHKLLRLGLNAAVYTDPHLQVIACNYLDERDAVLAVSHSGSSRCVVDSTQIAKHRGAKVISLTSAGKNPLSKLADISLSTHSKETKYRVVSIASRVAALTIADSIYTYIAMRTDGAKSLQIEKSMESLKY